MITRWNEYVAGIEPQRHVRLAAALGEGLRAARRAAEVAADNGAVQDARLALDRAVEELSAARGLLDEGQRCLWVRRRCGRGGTAIAARYWAARMAVVAPSPTAVATWREELAGVSPAVNRPGRTVSIQRLTGM